MGGLDLRAAVIKSLPSTLTTSRGDDYPIKWFYDEEADNKPANLQDFPFPHGRFRRLPSTWLARGLEDSASLDPVTHTDEQHIYVDGQLYYLLDNPDVASLTSVTGTRGGTPHTFTKVKVTPHDGYHTDSHLVFDVTETPDPGTTFLVSYTSHQGSEGRYSTMETPVQLSIVAQGDTHSSGNYYPKSDLAEELGIDLSMRLQDSRGQAFGDTPHNFVVQGPPDFNGPQPSFGGESTTSYLVRLPYLIHRRTGTPVETIAKTEYTVE